MSQEVINQLFKQYKESGDIAVRNQIAEHYLYIADILAKKFVGRGVEYDDLKQVASYALLRGIDRFDPDLGMQFTTFITPTITGEIKNYFRDKSRMVKLPRRLSEISMAVKKASGEYEAKHGVKPSAKWLAEHLKLMEEEVVSALEVGGTLSLDSMAGGEDDENRSLYALLPAAEDDYEEFETKEMFAAAMKDFSPEEKKLIEYRYGEQLSQSKTAEKLGMTQMSVSRLERKLLAQLKKNLEGSM